MRGASGLLHPTVAIGIDEKRHRLVIVSDDPDARSAALAQADIQAAHVDHHVIVARPISVNLSKVAEHIIGLVGGTVIGPTQFEKWSTKKRVRQKTIDAKIERFVNQGLVPAFQGFEWATVDLVAAWQDVIMQLSHLAIEPPSANSGLKAIVPSIRLGPLVALDPAEVDRQLGNCVVPLYDFTESDADIFHRSQDLDAVREVLRTRNLLQYFYPAPDQLALGFVDRGVAGLGGIVTAMRSAPAVGHPLSTPELVSVGTSLDDIVDALRDRKLVVEGEIGYELTTEGRTVRASVRFQPREGFLSKLSRILSLKVDVGLKDLFK